jgi:hypothetical protein
MPFPVVHASETSAPYCLCTPASDQQLSAASDPRLASSIFPSLSLSAPFSQLVWALAQSMRSLANLTEFLFAHNFSKPNREVL